MGVWSYVVTNWPHAARASLFSSETLAANLGISHRQLQRHFRDVSGLKLCDWLNQLRLDDAQHLLNGKYSVKEVAFLLGYSKRHPEYH